MKNHNLFSSTILSALLLLVLPVRANHLDGLWRNDRNNITLRIESLEEGFRAKRIDQGIWYKYMTKDGYHFTDRFGNTYIIQSDNELVWNEANSGRRIYFSRIENRREERWADWDNRMGYEYPYNAYNHGSWADPGHSDHAEMLNGKWISAFRHDALEIECFRDGIRVRNEHSGWEKYYLDRYDHSYRDKYGNSIRLIDSNSIRWESEHGRHERIYHRASGYHKENCG